MKIIMVLCFLIFTITFSNAQTINSDVYSSGGGEYENSYASISITIGEIATEMISNNGTTLTQGFQQGLLEISAIEETKNINISANIYPNPTQNTINLNIDYVGKENFTYQLCDNNGKVINNNTINSKNNTKIDVSKLAIGQYYLKIINTTLSYSKTFKIQKTGK